MYNDGMSETEKLVRIESSAPLEIERKFLINALPENIDQFAYTELRQGYIISTDTEVLRIRQEVDMHGRATWVQTIKKGRGQQRVEVEVPLTGEGFDTLWNFVENRIIEKRRHSVPLDSTAIAQVDLYQIPFGLATVEVEFASNDAANTFTAPSWFGDEVTTDKRFSNDMLARYGLPNAAEPVVQSPEIVISDTLRQGIDALQTCIDQRLHHQASVCVFAAGRTSAGKSSAITEQLVKRYGADQVLVISMDDYFGGEVRKEQLRSTVPDINWDHPAYVNLPLLTEHIRLLQAGHAVNKPSFNFKTGEPDVQTTRVSPDGKRILIFEGIHALHDSFDQFEGVRAFVDISLHGSIVRRLLRDVSRTNLDPASILGYYLRIVEPMYQQHIAPNKHKADVVLVNEYNPEIESSRMGVTDQQVKFRTTMDHLSLQKFGDHIASVAQTDYYFVPKEGKMVDEVVRIRQEHNRFYLAYKGPRVQQGEVITRPKFEFLLDEDTAHRLITYGEYGPLIKKIIKEREIYFCHGMLINHDTVHVEEETSLRDLGSFIEVRVHGSTPSAIDEQLSRLSFLGSDTMHPITTPYVLM